MIRLPKAVYVLALAVCASVTPARAVSAQVPMVVELRGGVASAPVHNGSAERVSVAIELRHGTVADGHLTLGDPVPGLIAPRAFELAPGATQVVRMLVREAVPAGTTLRLVTTLTPMISPPRGDATAIGASARLVLATRLITKVEAR